MTDNKEQPIIRRAIYAGSFNPISLGHLSILERSLSLFDEIVVGIGFNINKQYMFSDEERYDMSINSIQEFFPEEIQKRIRIEAFDTLLSEFCRKHEIKNVIRGLRANLDFEYEYQIAGVLHNLAPEIEVVHLLSFNHFQFISSSNVREIAARNGDISKYVTPYVAQKVAEKVKEMQRKT